MPKKELQNYNNALLNDDNLIGIEVVVRRGDDVKRQYFIADDVTEEVGRVVGTLIAMLGTLKTGDGSTLSEHTKNQLTKKWREVIRRG